MGIRVFAAGVLATDVRHGREIIITDDTDVEREENRALAAFSKLGMDKNGNTEFGTRAETALRYVLAEPMINCAVVGLAGLGHLRQVLNAASAGPLPLDVPVPITGFGFLGLKGSGGGVHIQMQLRLPLSL